jgi:hypothetical protein
LSSSSQCGCIGGTRCGRSASRRWGTRCRRACRCARGTRWCGSGGGSRCRRRGAGRSRSRCRGCAGSCRRCALSGARCRWVLRAGHQQGGQGRSHHRLHRGLQVRGKVRGVCCSHRGRAMRVLHSSPRGWNANHKPYPKPGQSHPGAFHDPLD